MKQLIKVGLGSLRLWRDEEVIAAYDPVRVLNRCTTLTRDAAVLASTTVAVEVWFPTGPRARYGLLGVRFEPDTSRQRQVYVGISSPSGPRLLDSIGAGRDEVRVGLPAEFADAVAERLHSEAVTRNLPAGTIAVNQAAHGAIGSNSSTFAALAYLLVRMIAERLDELPQDSIGEIVRETMVQSMYGQLGKTRDPM
jgi:hypothetical protein